MQSEVSAAGYVMASAADQEGGEMVALTVRVPRDLRQRLRVFAAEHDVSVQYFGASGAAHHLFIVAV